ALNYADVVRLYESLHTEVLGGIALTLAQLAFVPNFVIWVASWLVGPGFAIGTGSAVGPFTTQLGPVPAIPVFGALPEGDLAYGVIGILVPVVSGFLVAALARRGIVRGLRGASPAGWLVATGLGMGVVGGALLGALAAFSAGSAGPGRLVDVGPDPLWVALWAALEIGLAATLGLFAVRLSADDADRPASTGGTTHETGRGTANPSLAEKLLGRFRGGHGLAEPAQAPAGEPAESEQAPAPR
ncbi:MAG: hypothetical protein JWM51_775, partial [Microbacteriaceae bacterium]|nr:hypothetical protein [Microbacteriaceae bacterium]